MPAREDLQRERGGTGRKGEREKGVASVPVQGERLKPSSRLRSPRGLGLR